MKPFSRLVIWLYLMLLHTDYQHVAVVKAVFDMNLQQMQYVADNLSASECRQLVEALNSDQFSLNAIPSGRGVANVSCIRNLLLWDRTDGRGQSFHEVTLRLKKIGRPEVAAKISEAVYHEKAAAVQDTFLEDPFKDKINKNSGLLIESDKLKKGSK